jgi:Kef-type K+ transport system membrane component KefB
MIFGSFFIIIFFGLFGAMLTLNKELTNLSIYGATFYMLWYYVTKKIVNGMNSDKNGVIYFN